ncbi:hypothetical protein [Deinococcus ruber]|uniref:Uncharacterized protein n=1 Tax=Deinococcus ruber TaxID=1848197 RepID=A0A918F351_9DEIO|nr:hypothetical protein [Deinococcus ruber]GGQ96807.1 hypothetical protein GCM10008957_06350 [Deinococcus ruber]
MAAAGLPYSVSALLSGHTPLYLGLSLLALALACFAVWLSWRVWKDPALRTLNPFALLLFPAIGSAALSRMIRTLERGGALGIFDVIEVGGLIVGLSPLFFHPSGFRRLLKGGA